MYTSEWGDKNNWCNEIGTLWSVLGDGNTEFFVYLESICKKWINLVIFGTKTSQKYSQALGLLNNRNGTLVIEG